MKTQFNSDWKNWIAENLNAGRDPDGIFKILLDEGYVYDAIVREMNYSPSKPVSDLVNPFANSKQHSQEETKNNPARVINVGAKISRDRITLPTAKTFNVDRVDLRVLPNFLTKQECNKVKARIKSRLRASEISTAQVDTAYRSSRTCDLGRLNDPFIEAIDIKICTTMGIHRAYSEVLEGQYYEVGQEFKAHTDFFKSSEFAVQCHEFGQRTYTFMVYLNEVDAGGETCFDNLGLSFKPEVGTALIWNNLYENGLPNMHTVHQAKPVLKGHKAVITKWFRSKPAKGYEYLPMLTKNVNAF